MRDRERFRRPVSVFTWLLLVMTASFIGIQVFSRVKHTRVTSCTAAGMKREPVGPGEESVWDYPRPPRLEKTTQRVRVDFNGQTIADTTDALRILETSHPPTYYIPFKDCKQEFFRTSSHRTFCEFKGTATYFDIDVDGKVERAAAWMYPKVTDKMYQPLEKCIAVYPSRMSGCFVNDEKATPQEGAFYGGWITKNIKGPFKGGAGTWGW